MDNKSGLFSCPAGAVQCGAKFTATSTTTTAMDMRIYRAAGQPKIIYCSSLFCSKAITLKSPSIHGTFRCILGGFGAQGAQNQVPAENR